MTVEKACSADHWTILERNASKVLQIGQQWIQIGEAAGWISAPQPDQGWHATFEYLDDRPVGVLEADDECLAIVVSLFPELASRLEMTRVQYDGASEFGRSFVYEASERFAVLAR